MLLSCFHVPHFIIVYAFILAASLERVGPIIRCLHSINDVMLTGDGPFRGLVGAVAALPGRQLSLCCGLLIAIGKRYQHDQLLFPSLQSDDICPVIKQW